jgi:hypothetical protein
MTSFPHFVESTKDLSARDDVSSSVCEITNRPSGILLMVPTSTSQCEPSLEIIFMKRELQIALQRVMEKHCHNQISYRLLSRVMAKTSLYEKARHGSPQGHGDALS